MARFFLDLKWFLNCPRVNLRGKESNWIFFTVRKWLLTILMWLLECSVKQNFEGAWVHLQSVLSVHVYENCNVYKLLLKAICNIRSVNSTIIFVHLQCKFWWIKSDLYQILSSICPKRLSNCMQCLNAYNLKCIDLRKNMQCRPSQRKDKSE